MWIERDKWKDNVRGEWKESDSRIAIASFGCKNIRLSDGKDKSSMGIESWERFQGRAKHENETFGQTLNPVYIILFRHSINKPWIVRMVGVSDNLCPITSQPEIASGR